MLIQLRQSEIETALRDYIVNQGINLTGRTVEISFTSGRKDNGISADLDITEIQHSLKAVPSGPIKRGFEAVEPVQCSSDVHEKHPPVDPEEALDASDFKEDTSEPVAEVPVKTAASLFG